MILPNPLDQAPVDFQALREVSARLGSDPMLVQSAGGNTSVKDGELMWIKASGTLLADAMLKDIFVAVDLPRMHKAITQGDPSADQPQHFLGLSTSTLRPSIETSLHAVLPQRVVLHVHCIHTLAHAVRSDSDELLKDRLSGLSWAMVPYTKPGAELAMAVSERLTDETNVVILRNHGLIVSGDSVKQAQQLVYEVHDRLAITPAPESRPDTDRLLDLTSNSSYQLPDHKPVHQLALDPARVEQATKGSLYPDHVIFCGIAASTLPGSESLNEYEHRLAQDQQKPPVFLIIPGAGVVIRKDASSGALALIRCLSDVLARVPGDAKLSYLSHEQNSELLDWDAEKYRQSLNLAQSKIEY